MILFLLQDVWKTKLRNGKKKIKEWNNLAVNDLIELPNFRIYTACKKEALQFSAKKGTCSEKILHMTVQHEESEIRRSAI